MSDIASRVGWGVVLDGHAFDLADWKEALKEPFDPWVMETEGRLILRSSALDPATTSSDAYESTKGLMEQVRGVLAISHPKAEAVRIEAVAEIMSDGSVRRHIFLAAEAIKLRSRVFGVGLTIGPDGNPAPPPPPEPSDAQRWLSIAAEDDLLADALTYVARGDDWFDVYKALECLIGRFGGGKEAEFLALGWANAERIKLLKRTADSWGAVRNSVREAMMMKRRESSHGYREGTSGPIAGRSRSERGICQGWAARRSEEGAFGADSERRAR